MLFKLVVGKVDDKNACRLRPRQERTGCPLSQAHQARKPTFFLLWVGCYQCAISVLFMDLTYLFVGLFVKDLSFSFFWSTYISTYPYDFIR